MDKFKYCSFLYYKCYEMFLHHAVIEMIYLWHTKVTLKQSLASVMWHISECNTICGRGFGSDFIKSVRCVWIAQKWLSKHSVTFKSVGWKEPWFPFQGLVNSARTNKVSICSVRTYCTFIATFTRNRIGLQISSVSLISLLQCIFKLVP